MLRYNLVGQKFVKLDVKGTDGKIGNHIAWLCECECGNTIRTLGKSLLSGVTKSCGCLRKISPKLANTTHGMTNTPEYWAFINAKRRCQNPKSQAYARYGGRGIEFRFISFEEFLGEVGFRPSDDYSLDRENNDGHYEKGNVKWSTYKEQANNRHNSGKYIRMLEEKCACLEDKIKELERT